MENNTRSQTPPRFDHRRHDPSFCYDSPVMIRNAMSCPSSTGSNASSTTSELNGIFAGMSFSLFGNERESNTVEEVQSHESMSRPSCQPRYSERIKVKVVSKQKAAQANQSFRAVQPFPSGLAFSNNHTSEIVSAKRGRDEEHQEINKIDENKLKSKFKSK